MENIMGCMQCGAPVENSLRTGKPKKYCSKKCANKFFHEKEKKRHPRYNDPTWKNKTKIEKLKDQKKSQEKFARFEWLNENWFGYESIQTISELTRGQIHHRVKVLGIVGEQIAVHIDGKTKTYIFFSPEDKDKIINYKYKIVGKGEYPPSPKGYLTTEEVVYLLKDSGIYQGTRKPCEVISAMRLRIKNFPKFSKYQKSNTGKVRALYCEDQINGRIQSELQARLKEKEKRELAKKLLEEERQAKKARKFQKKLAKKRREEEEDRLHRENNKCIVCGSGIPKNRHHSHFCSQECTKSIQTLPEGTKKHEIAPIETLYFHSETTAELAKKNNETYKKQKQFGIIKKFTCKNCGQKKSYEEFYRDLTYVSGRRTAKCKGCIREIAREKYDPEKAKQQRIDNHVARMRCAVAHSIRTVVARYSGEMKQMRIPEVWNHLEENLGYDAETLCEHIENQFDENMNWENWGQINNESFTWNMDHIIPQSHYAYTHLEDPRLLECWKLENLRPLDARKNISKSNKLTRGEEH
jgi:predicted nucleic acid-binding Zn ribbon protein